MIKAVRYLSLGACLMAATFAVPANAPADTGHVSIQITAILATKDGGEIDDSLKNLEAELRTLPFTGFRLITKKSCKISVGENCAVDASAHGRLQITSKSQSPEVVAMQVVLNKNNKPVINSAITLRAGAGINVSGPKTDNGVIVFSIRFVGGGSANSVLSPAIRAKTGGSKRRGPNIKPPTPMPPTRTRADLMGPKRGPTGSNK